MDEDMRSRRFEDTVLPHLDAAYNLARWLTRDGADAEDVVQEAVLRALQFFDGYRGGNSRAWLLTIVRNTCFNWMKRNRRSDMNVPYDDESQMAVAPTYAPPPAGDPETLLLARLEQRQIDAAIGALAPPLREAIVLREMEDLSYAEIAEIAGVPIGTVMSRLARARNLLRRALRAPDLDPRP